MKKNFDLKKALQVVHQNEEGDDALAQKAKCRNAQALERLDRMMGESFISADENGVYAMNAVMLAAFNVAEYGCWHTDGNAQEVAIMMLRGIARHFEKYRSPDGYDYDNDEMEICIHSEMLEGSDGKMETRLLIAALADHIQAQEIATREEATHDATDTHH